MDRHGTRGRRDEPLDLRPIRRPWDNADLRHRVEGREIEGVDVVALQNAVVAKQATASQRRRRGSS